MKLKTTAEHLVSLLAAHGVEYLFLNPGTDTAPVQEAVYSLAEAGLPVPTVLLSTFESVSLAAAHAYWKMTGRPQAIFVHVDAGTQNLGAQVHNVLRDRAGVIVIAGKTPYGRRTARRAAGTPRSSGSRTSPTSRGSSAATPSGSRRSPGRRCSTGLSAAPCRSRPARRPAWRT